MFNFWTNSSFESKVLLLSTRATMSDPMGGSSDGDGSGASPPLMLEASPSLISGGNPTQAPRYGTVIPNRIFVGGIDFKVNEAELKKYFTQFGAVKDVKIINDRAGVSKGYGFVTFESQEDAQKIQQEAEKIMYKDKKLNIGPAIRKQQVGFPQFPLTPASGSMVLTTSTGQPFLFHNGVAYFQQPDAMPVQMPIQQHQTYYNHQPMHIPSPQASPVYQQPAYSYQQAPPSQWSTGQWLWSPPQAPQSPVMYMQPQEMMYHHQSMNIPTDGGNSPAGPIITDVSISERYTDHTMQAAYHQTHLHPPNNMQVAMVSQDHVKDTKMFHMRRVYGTSQQGGVKSRMWRNATGFRHRRDLQMERAILTPPPTPTEGGQ
ncbi:protein boule-like [Lampetra fluviatilis]